VSRKMLMLLAAHGNIGSGKSTLLEAVASLAPQRITVIPEPIEKWCAPYVGGRSMLEAFYEDKRGTAMAFQMYVMLTQKRWFLESSAGATTPVLLMERGSWEGVDPMSQLMREEGYMTPVEWEVYSDWRREVQSPGHSGQRGLVYLRTPPEQCMARIRKRNRAEEASVTPEYLQRVHDVHERMAEDAAARGLPVLVLDGSKAPRELAAEVVAWTGITSPPAATGLDSRHAPGGLDDAQQVQLEDDVGDDVEEPEQGRQGRKDELEGDVVPRDRV